MNVTDATKARDQISSEIIGVTRRHAELADALHGLRTRRDAMKTERGAAVVTGDERAISKLRRETLALDVETEDHELAIAKLDGELAELKQAEATATSRVAAAELFGLEAAVRAAASAFDAACGPFVAAAAAFVAANRALADRRDLIEQILPGHDLGIPRGLLPQLLLWPLHESLPDLVGWVRAEDRTTVAAFIERSHSSARDLIERELG